MSPYSHLDRTMMVLNTIIKDVCFDKKLSEDEVEALAFVAAAKVLLEKATAKLDKADANYADVSIKANQGEDIVEKKPTLRNVRDL